MTSTRETEGEGVWPKVICTCPSCGGLLLGEEHTDPDGSPNGWYCMECDEREFEPRDVPVLPASVAEELADALGTALDLAERAHAGMPRTGEEWYAHWDHAKAALTRYQATKEATDAH